MAIDIRQLRYVVSTADMMSFSKAASANHVKQSTLSKGITHLELQLGMTLFERSTRGATPSASGKAFVEVARRIVSDIDNLGATARAAECGEAGRIIIGFSSSLSTGHLKMMLSDFLSRYPDVQLDAVEAGAQRLACGLQARMIDVAVHAGDLTDTGIYKRQLWSERMMVVLPEQHRLASADAIFWTDLRQEAFVVPSLSGGPVIGKLIAGRLLVHGYDANITTQEAAQDNIMGMVGLGKFITVVGESALGMTRAGLVFREIEEPNSHARLDYAAYWRADNENPALKRFFKLVDERYPSADPP